MKQLSVLILTEGGSRIGFGHLARCCALVKKFQNRPPDPQRSKLFFDWAGMSEREFYMHIDAKRDRQIWDRRPDGTWQLSDSIERHTQDAGADKVRLKKSEGCAFSITASRDPQVKDDRYLLIGRGHVDVHKVPYQGISDRDASIAATKG